MHRHLALLALPLALTGLGGAASPARAQQARAQQARAQQARAQEAHAQEARTQEAHAQEARAQEARAQEARTQQARAQEARTQQARTQPAAGEECAAVVSALTAMAAASRYHWSMSAVTPTRRRPLAREQVVMGDIVYMTPDEGLWMRQLIPLAERATRMAQELARAPLTRCRRLGDDRLGDVPVTLYGYDQGASGDRGASGTGPEAADPEGAPAKRIWIGTQDGLPHLLKATDGATSVTTRVEYDHVVAPLP